MYGQIPEFYTLPDLPGSLYWGESETFAWVVLESPHVANAIGPIERIFKSVGHATLDLLEATVCKPKIWLPSPLDDCARITGKNRITYRVPARFIAFQVGWA
jgi:hypothetical protein